MKLGKSVDVLWFQLKFSGSRMQDGRELLIGKNLSCSDSSCAMCGSGLSSSGALFLVSLDVAGSLDQADLHS